MLSHIMRMHQPNGQEEKNSKCMQWINIVHLVGVIEEVFDTFFLFTAVRNILYLDNNAQETH